MHATILQPRDPHRPARNPTLGRVFDRYEITNPTPGYTITSYAVVPDWENWLAFACPGCGAWQLDHMPDAQNPASATALRAALEEHRAECAALDMLAGLQGVPPA